MVQPIKLVHFIPGRLRVTSPYVKGNEDIAVKLQQIVKHFPVIENVEVNSTTGSVLLEYDEDDKKAIHSLLMQARLIGYLPEDIDIQMLTGILCGSVAPGEGLHELRKLESIPDVIPGILPDTQDSADYLQEMTSPTLYFVGIRMLLSALNPVPLWFDYFWVGYSSLTALNHVTRQGIRLPDL